MYHGRLDQAWRDLEKSRRSLGRLFAMMLADDSGTQRGHTVSLLFRGEHRMFSEGLLRTVLRLWHEVRTTLTTLGIWLSDRRGCLDCMARKANRRVARIAEQMTEMLPSSSPKITT